MRFIINFEKKNGIVKEGDESGESIDWIQVMDLPLTYLDNNPKAILEEKVATSDTPKDKLIPRMAD